VNGYIAASLTAMAAPNRARARPSGLFGSTIGACRDLVLRFINTVTYF